ncbi:hypothetical protein KQX54_008228 [Cotesia glomerata]|uniref:Uncharacterized protein n=1 Tax=Cotesia glomerata TaxID=32391 RepID=A0AAV7J532_COTGL|nr:hypothetical protein KQX54_008228 [Cotesia glomerata]
MFWLNVRRIVSFYDRVPRKLPDDTTNTRKDDLLFIPVSYMYSDTFVSTQIVRCISYYCYIYLNIMQIIPSIVATSVYACAHPLIEFESKSDGWWPLLLVLRLMRTAVLAVAVREAKG